MWETPDGAVRGFLGVLPLRLVHHGQVLRGAIGSSVMVEDAVGDPLAGARLLRAFLDGPQDLAFGEGVAEVTRRMMLTLGARAATLRGLGWLCVLRPAAFAADVAARRARRDGVPMPIAAALGRVLARPPAAAGSGRDIAPAQLAAIIPDAVAGFALRPDFDPSALAWLLAEAARKETLGAPIARIVPGRRGWAAGGWLGHLRPRGVLRILQAFAPAGMEEAVVDDILAAAWQHGAAAVAGRAQPELLDAVARRGAVFRGADAMMVHARDPALLAAAQGEGAFLGGLAGEGWLRLSGGAFD